MVGSFFFFLVAPCTRPRIASALRSLSIITLSFSSTVRVRASTHRAHIARLAHAAIISRSLVHRNAQISLYFMQLLHYFDCFFFSFFSWSSLRIVLREFFIRFFFFFIRSRQFHFRLHFHRRTSAVLHCLFVYGATKKTKTEKKLAWFSQFAFTVIGIVVVSTRGHHTHSFTRSPAN